MTVHVSYNPRVLKLSQLQNGLPDEFVSIQTSLSRLATKEALTITLSCVEKISNLFIYISVYHKHRIALS